jgi:hypothetical protein
MKRAEATSSPRRRLVFFLLGLAVSVLALEFLVRWNATLFEGASHRGLAKAAMYELRPRVDLLFLGTSRAQDGISPWLVTRALGEVASERSQWAGFNAAFTGSSLGELTALGKRFSRRAGLRAVIIELSAPQIHNRPAPWDQERANEALPTWEAQMADFVRKSALVRYRTAFLPENLGRLPALLMFSASLGGWETKGSDQLAAWLGKKEVPAQGFEATLWNPEVVLPEATAVPLDPVLEEAAEKLTELVGLFRERGTPVVFAVPPLARGHQPAPERDQLRPFFVELARRAGCEVWNFAPLVLPDHLFRDPSHLGREGRAHYSRALALQIAQRIKGT